MGTRPTGVWILLAVLLLMAMGVLAWSILLPSESCGPMVGDFGTCSNNSSLKVMLAVISGWLLIGCLLGWIATRPKENSL